jgi:hypothetical protein
VGMVGGGSTSLDVLAVHNYDLKKKIQSSGHRYRNDNYDLKKKKIQKSGRFIITSGKKKAQLSGHQWEWLGGFQKLGCFSGFIITTCKKKRTVVWPSVGLIIMT